VYAPELDELYTATAERPSECNGSSIRVSDIDEVEESMVFTGLDKNVLPDVPPYEIFKKIAVNAQKTRVMGCASHDMCRVACGQGEGYFEAGIHIWDVAASGLIVQQAGGRAEVIGRYADNRLQFLATNGRIHEELKKLVELNA
jgi:myo-inositol-1(or 4)-monophosphatase